MSYKERVKANGDDDAVGEFRCRGCGAVTPWDTLSALGARCERCYASYCASPRLAPHLPSVKSSEDPKAWAHALRARELASARLTRVQMQAWRDALEPRVHDSGVAL